ncbi:hypothetical protein H8356DRAFT_1335166 [Neocallimastix lanati (nom. inval.)]|nr:hypothetical protein H8356DRAFT_1335166 [Neocallimastix sp. JGI-2020a]
MKVYIIILKKNTKASKSIDNGINMSLNFNSIRTQIIRSQNEQLLTLLDITTFEEIPEQRNQNKKYYQTENAKTIYTQYNEDHICR